MPFKVGECVECSAPCLSLPDGAPSRCRACLILREVYPLPPDIETT